MPGEFYVPCTVLLLFLFLVPVKADAVVLKKTATVRTSPFTLDKIVEGTLAEGMGGITLGNLPEPGNSRVISRAYIIMQARKQGKQAPSFEGPIRQVSVKRPSLTIDQQNLREKIRHALRSEFAVTDDARIKLKHVPGELRALPGPVEIEVGERNQYQTERGTSRYRMILKQSGTTVDEFQVEASVTRKSEVPVALEPIARGQSVTSSMVEFKSRNISSLDGNIINKKDRVIGYESKRNIDSGEIITGDELKKPIVVRRNNPVTIVRKHGGVTITTKGEAREDGARGDRIMVENQTSEVKLLAEVVGERRVLIRDESNRSQSNQ